MSEPLMRRARVRCSVERAFTVFTASIDAWWPASHRRSPHSVVELEPREGGRFLERSDDGVERTLGSVVIWQPPTRLSYTWLPGAIAAPTRVDVSFLDRGDHTLVEIVHSEGDSALGEQWPERVQKFARAWSEVLPAFVRLADEQEGR